MFGAIWLWAASADAQVISISPAPPQRKPHPAATGTVPSHAQPTHTSSPTALGGYTAFNSTPVAVDDGYSTNEDGTLVTSAAAGVLANDSDADGHSLTAFLDVDVEHGELVGMLVEYGHRLGLRAHVSDKERRRAYLGGTVADLLTEEEQRAYLPLVAAGDVATLESLDCIWYLRGKATFLFEVEWTALLTEPLLRRGPRIPPADTVVRFLVVPSERVELIRFKVARSPLLRRALDEQNWHILKSEHLRRLMAREEAHLDQLGPMLGLDPDIEREAEQLALFG